MFVIQCDMFQFNEPSSGITAQSLNTINTNFKTVMPDYGSLNWNKY
jgi:hypothetical protein